jgi:hypothetical protein
MIIAKTLLEENAYTSAQWVSGVSPLLPANPVLPIRVLGYDTTVRKYKMGDGVTTWDLLPWWSDIANAALVVTRNSGTTSPYTLTSGQRAQVNAYGRYPTFAAFISGLQYDDIYPIYTGSPGSFTSVIVQLHDDGTGNNPDTTVVQFS